MTALCVVCAEGCWSFALYMGWESMDWIYVAGDRGTWQAPVSMIIGCLVDWLVGWSVGRLVGWLVGWSVGRLVGRSVSPLKCDAMYLEGLFIYYYYYYYYYYFILQLSFHSVAAVITLVTNKNKCT